LISIISASSFFIHDDVFLFVFVVVVLTNSTENRVSVGFSDNIFSNLVVVSVDDTVARSCSNVFGPGTPSISSPA